MAGYVLWVYKEDGTPLTLKEMSENIKKNMSTIPVWNGFLKTKEEKTEEKEND